jgi:phospholipid/cholesterol/gamma-HCH transport system ATP-binding protein
MISLNSLYKRFGAQEVLRGVSLDVGPEEMLAVVGPSGAGKSVLIKLILGILEPDSGAIIIDNINISRLRTEEQRNTVRAKLGMLFQSAALLDSLTVFQNVAFPLEISTSLSPKEICKEVEHILESLSLLGYASAIPQEISIGIRKRVGLARALVRKPKIVLFDEPNTGLDPLVGQEVYDLIKETRSVCNYTGVIISHEIPEVFQVSDRVAMLLHGKVAALGSPSEICRSEDPTVQQFLSGSISGPISLH